MPNFKKLINFEFNSSFVRFFLGLYFKPKKFYKIPFGMLKGLIIWYDRTINYHAVLGLWERNSFEVLNRVLQRMAGDQPVIFYDVGANIGLYSLFVSKFKYAVKVVAFEPVAETAAILKSNLQRNNITDVECIEKAVTNADGPVTFYIGHHHKSSLSESWASGHGTEPVNKVTVQGITLDSFVKLFPRRTPDVIKIDVEGAGHSVLEGCWGILTTKRPLVLFESHNPVEDRAIMNALQALTYKAYRINTKKWVLNINNDYHDPDGIWGTMLLIPEEKSFLINES